MVGGRSYAKTFWRTLFSNKGRFFGSLVINMLALVLTAGLAALPVCLGESFSQNYQSMTTPDLIIKSKAATGFSQEEILSLTSLSDVQTSDTFLSFDSLEGDTYYRFYFADIANMKSGKPVLLSGAYPTQRGEILALEGNNTRAQPTIGETLHFSGLSFFAPSDLTVTGVGRSPLYLHRGKNLANLEENPDNLSIAGVYYVDVSTMPKFLANWKSDIYLYLNTPHAYFSDEYKATMEAKKAEIYTVMPETDIKVLTLEENESYRIYKEYDQKIKRIGYVFPFLFILLCTLVSSTTITRLMRDERPQIATAISLGEPSRRIVAKYAWFSTTNTLLGAIIGYFIGVTAMPALVYPAYNTVFIMGGIPIVLFNLIGVLTSAVLLLVSFFFAWWNAARYIGHSPASLMSEPAPKPGKKILLERIPFFWKRLSFSLKAMFRNIFRLKKNFFLTAISVGGSTLLVFLGLSLLNVSKNLKNGDLFANVASSISAVSTVIVLLAVSVAVAVGYLLGNMNIEDRKREIATLKVLGYNERECHMYCFRELVLVSALGALISLPLDAFAADGIFRYLEFGSLADIQWWTYVISPLIVLSATVIMDLVLGHRIRKIDTVSSLKSVE